MILGVFCAGPGAGLDDPRGFQLRIFRDLYFLGLVAELPFWL